jgi:hypothetical protein
MTEIKVKRRYIYISIYLDEEVEERFALEQPHKHLLQGAIYILPILCHFSKRISTKERRVLFACCLESTINCHEKKSKQ